MNIIKRFLILFGFMQKPEDKTQNYKIVFGEEAATKGEHGAIVGKWSRAGYGTRDITISFHFEAFGIPPQLSKHVFEVLLNQAAEQGIVFSHVYSYGALRRARCDYSATGYDGMTPKVATAA